MSRSLVAASVVVVSATVLQPTAVADTPLPWPIPSSLPTSLPPGFPSVIPGLPSLPLPPVPTASVPSLGAPVPAIGSPFVRVAPFTITPRSDAPKIVPYLKSTPYARFAPDGKTLLLAGSTTRIVTTTNPAGKVLEETHGYRTAFSPDSTRMVASDEDGALRLFAIPSGKIERKIEGAFPGKGGASQGAFVKEVAFPENGTVYFHTGCRLKKFTPPNGEVISIGTSDRCTRASVAANGVTWLLLEESNKPYGVGVWYTRAETLDRDTGATKVFLDAKTAGPFGDVRVSPDGRRFCFTKPDGYLACTTTQGGPIEVVSDTPINRAVAWDQTGDRLLYADAVQGWAPKAIHLVDLVAHTLRKITIVSKDAISWHFLSGGTRFVTQGYDGAVVYDLVKGWSMTIFSSGESESFAAVPGNPTRMLLGQAKGPSTDLSWVQLPD